MKKLISFIFIVFFTLPIFSDNVKISLLTCTASEEVYERFGHTGIRIQTDNEDYTVHYGLYDFSTPFFVPKFVQGELDYYIGDLPTIYFLDIYRSRGSKVIEQELNLTDEEKKDLIEKIKENLEPQNRAYRYDFIRDNCSTRPIALIEEEIIGLIYSETRETTYRTIIEESVGAKNWWKFGIDIVIGADADTLISDYPTISFPLYAKNFLKRARKRDGSKIVLSEKIIVNGRDRYVEETPFYKTPLFFFSFVFLLVVGISIMEFKLKRNFYIVDKIFAVILTVVGCVITYLMFVSKHPLVGDNLNILWANPLLIIGLKVIDNKSYTKFAYVYYQIVLFLLLNACVIFIVWVQEPNLAFYPILLTLLLRYALIIRKKRKTLNFIFIESVRAHRKKRSSQMK